MKRILRILLLLFLVLLIGGAGAGYWIYKDLHTPVYHNKAVRFVEIPRGSTPAVVVNRLVSEGVIRHQWPLELYMKFTGAGARLKAGDYKFPSPITPLAVLQRLEQGEQRMVRLTIIEGWTRWDIASAMSKIRCFRASGSSLVLIILLNAVLSYFPVQQWRGSTRESNAVLLIETSRDAPTTKRRSLASF